MLPRRRTIRSPGTLTAQTQIVRAREDDEKGSHRKPTRAVCVDAGASGRPIVMLLRLLGAVFALAAVAVVQASRTHD